MYSLVGFRAKASVRGRGMAPSTAKVIVRRSMNDKEETISGVEAVSTTRLCESHMVVDM